MSECTVHSPCGRYVVHFASDTARHVLRLNVASKSQQRADAARTTTTAPTALSAPAPANGAPAASSSSSSAHATPLRLVACLGEVDVAALTASAGVRKSFRNFADMLYGALIGRSAAVHFYVETVAEMKERIQRDVQRHQPLQSSALSERCPATTAAAATAVATAEEEASSRSLLLTTSTAAMMAGASTSAGRLRTRVGDTVIELDEDIAAEVLEQRFLTLDYDVDFTRAIFPIPLRVSEASEATATRSNATCRVGDDEHASALRAASTGTHAAASTGSPEETLHAQLAHLREALARAEADNAKLRREKDALVQVSRHKMEEMQRLCADFEAQVRLAAEAERLRATNAALRVELQEALEGQQALLRTLERERSHRRLLPHSTSAAGTRASRADASSAASGEPRRGGGSRAGSRQSSTGSTAGARRSTSGPREEGNPYLRSLSRDSYGRQRSVGSTTIPKTGAAPGYQHVLQPRRGEQQPQHQQRRRPLMSPTPPPAGTRGSCTLRSPSPVKALGRRSTRFDTPPPHPTSARAGGGAGTGLAQRHRSHSWRDRDGDSPAPHGRTGGRLEAALKPRRGGSSGGRTGAASGTAPSPGGSRASSAHSLPQRGASLWAGSSDRASACGSAASSSRCSSTSATGERLYHAATARSRLRRSPKAHLLDDAAPSRRAVFR